MNDAPADITQDIPVGDIQFYDNYIPPLEAGPYRIRVEQTLTDRAGAAINDHPLVSEKAFIVTAPQFTLDPNQIVNRYPPAGSTGEFGSVLPSLVLRDPSLPWERALGSNGTPWLALMVFADGELIEGYGTGETAKTANPATYAYTGALRDYLAMADYILVPAPEIADDVNPASVCQYILMPAELFQAIVPRIDELPFLAHVRKVNTGDKPILGLNEHGLFSVITANRFAATPNAGNPKPRTNIAHLVSLEGFSEAQLAAGTDLGGYTGGVAVITLASWTFLCQPDNPTDFYALAMNLVASEEATGGSGPMEPDRLLLRLPPPSAAGGGQARTVAAGRVADGYVPLGYHTRTGESTFGWYRGPLAPVQPSPLAPHDPFCTADAALIYDETFGVFDVSLASAWEAGREAALADPYFGQRLLDARKRAHRLTDGLAHRLASDHFAPTRIDQVDPSSTVQDTFLSLVSRRLIVAIGATAEKPPPPPRQAPPSPPPTDPTEDIRAFLADETVQASLRSLIAADLAPIADWLGELMLLHPVPFDNLVPDERLLPIESIRFFYVDFNWLAAAVDGALSLGLESSRHTSFARLTRDIVFDAALRALAVVRDKRRGIPVGTSPTPPAVISGFLLRSALVSGWPTLAVRAKDEGGAKLDILRMDHLSANVLFCLFDGVPDTIELSQPQETLAFGTEGANVALRRIPADAAGPELPVLPIRDPTGRQKRCMRALDSRVLNITPADAEGLVQTLTASLTAHGSPPPGGTLTASTFALQMIRSAQAIVFASQLD